MPPESSASGAGIANTAGAPVSINNSTVSGNTATATTTGAGFPADSVFAIASGTAIQMSQGGALNISTSTISNNTGTANGNQTATAQGAITNDGGPITVSRSTISGNATTAHVSEVAEAGSGIATTNGGGILIAGGASTLALDGTTVSGNSATATAAQGGSGSAVGGGMYLWETFAASLDGSATGSTIAGNAVSNAGGSGSGSLAGANVGLNTFAAFSSTPFSSQNTIIAGGTGAANCGQVGDVPFTSLGYNIDSGNTCLGATPEASDQVNTDPALGPLLDNGGPTETRAPGITSPAVDQGIAAGDPTDQRGLARTFNMNPSTPTGGDGSDIGAFEQTIISGPSTSHDFGTQRWGSSTTWGSPVTLLNRTGNSLTPALAFSGTSPGDFLLSSNTCTTALANNATCSANAVFHPVSAGNGPRAATLSFPTNVAPTASVDSIDLTGDATEFISLAPTPKDFGSTQL